MVYATLRPLYPREARYPLYRRLGGPQSRSGRCGKSRPPPGFDPSFPILKTESAYAEIQATARLLLCNCGVTFRICNCLTTRCCSLLSSFIHIFHSATGLKRITTLRRSHCIFLVIYYRFQSENWIEICSTRSRTDFQKGSQNYTLQRISRI